MTAVSGYWIYISKFILWTLYQWIRDGPRVPVDTDWLTHVPLEFAKEMRLLAPYVTENFGHLGSVVGELWHNQRDLLEKLYKRFFRKANSRTELRLAFIATILRRTDVTREVKTPHKEFLRNVSNELFAAQAMEYFGMVTKQDAPTKNQWPDITNSTAAEKRAITDE